MNATADKRARGMAALTVVMVLFFVMALVAAYTNRNLVFEQRISANSYKATRALEAADAGVEWTIGLLNAGRMYLNIPAQDDLAGIVYLSSGLGGMSGAQAKAVEIAGGIGVLAEVDRSRIETRLQQGWVSRASARPTDGPGTMPA